MVFGNIIERIRHLQGSNCIEDRQNVNDSYDLEWLTQQDPVVESKLGQDLLGVGTIADRTTWAATTTEYVIPVNLGFLRTGILPFGFICNDGGREYRGLEGFHDLEFYLADPTLYIETDGTSPTVYLSEVRLDYVKIEGKEYEKKLANHFRSGNCALSWKSIDRYQNPCFQVSQLLKIAHRARFIDWIVNVFTDLDAQQTTGPTTANNNRRWNYPKLTVESFQFKDAPLGGQNSIFPSEAVDTKVLALSAYELYLRWCQGWSVDGFPRYAPQLTLTDFNGPSTSKGLFLMIGDFRSNVTEDRNQDNNIVNLFSSDNNYSDMKLDLRLASAPSLSTAVNHFIQYSVVMKVTREGAVILPDVVRVNP